MCSLKLARLHVEISVREALPRDLRRSGFAAAGDSAASNDGRRPAAAIAAQRELRDDEHRAAVSPPTDSSCPAASSKIRRSFTFAGDVCDVVGAVALFHAGEHEQAAANLADHALVDADARG